MQPPDAIGAAAEVLREAGDVVVIWGERVFSGQRGSDAVEALLALAAALGIADREESGLIAIPESTNGRGLREVGCSPTLAPGLADAAETGDPHSARGALLLVETELPEAVLAEAASVIAFARFRSEALDEEADVVFPAEIYAEKEGTVTHPDGRLQRVRQALGHAGQVRAGWQVLAELCERAGAGLPVRSGSEVTALIAEQVPIYAGLTLDAIGGLGVRWQEHDGATALAAEEISSARLADPPPAPEGGLRAIRVPTLWSGPEVEQSPSLRFLSVDGRAELSVDDARELGLESGDEVELRAGGARAGAQAIVRSGVPKGSVFVAGADLPDGPVELRPARAGAGVA
jgi:NADH-quinone oxidoreductase subunit G